MDVKNYSKALNEIFYPLDDLVEAVNNAATLGAIASDCDFEDHGFEAFQNYWNIQLTYLDKAKTECDKLMEVFRSVRENMEDLEV